MTREEAIEVLKLVDENASCDDCLYYAQMEDCPTDEDCIIRQALDMAIQALSQEPCTDAVSRVNAVRCVLSSLFLVEASEKIEKLPSVTQKSETVTEFADRCRECGAKYGKMLKQKSGKWVEMPIGFKCSKCDELENRTTKFCPNCGAKIEPQESEDKAE